jgi:hypothetical protein
MPRKLHRNLTFEDIKPPDNARKHMYFSRKRKKTIGIVNEPKATKQYDVTRVVYDMTQNGEEKPTDVRAYKKRLQC